MEGGMKMGAMVGFGWSSGSGICFGVGVSLAGKVADMLATCRPDSRQAPDKRTQIHSRHIILCRGLPTFSKFFLSTRGTYRVIIVQTSMYKYQTIRSARLLFCTPHILLFSRHTNILLCIHH